MELEEFQDHLFLACLLLTILKKEKTLFILFLIIEYSTAHKLIFLYYLILILALITNFFTLKIRKLPVGRAWEALREDEIACKSLGVNPTNTKLTAFAIGCNVWRFCRSFLCNKTNICES